MRRSSCGGFTLVEELVALGVAGVLTVVTLQLFLGTQSSARLVANQEGASKEWAALTKRAARFVREAGVTQLTPRDAQRCDRYGCREVTVWGSPRTDGSLPQATLQTTCAPSTSGRAPMTPTASRECPLAACPAGQRAVVVLTTFDGVRRHVTTFPSERIGPASGAVAASACIDVAASEIVIRSTVMLGYDGVETLGSEASLAIPRRAPGVTFSR